VEVSAGHFKGDDNAPMTIIEISDFTCEACQQFATGPGRQIDQLLIFLVLWSLRKRIKTDDYLFALFLGLYAAGKFAITFSRIDPVWLWGLQQSHFVALGLGLLALAWAWSNSSRAQRCPPQPRHA
jgi:hypothetical protein